MIMLVTEYQAAVAQKMLVQKLLAGLQSKLKM